MQNLYTNFRCTTILAILSLCFIADPSFSADLGRTNNLFDLKKMAKDVKTLSSDAFEGRAPSTPGEEKTVAYIVKRFKEAGLMPGNQGSWFQKVPLVRIDADKKIRFRFKNAKGNSLELNLLADFVAWSPWQDSKIDLEDRELIFAGYGVDARAWDWNDFGDMDVRDKVLVVLVNDPGFATKDSTLFNGKAMTYYGRWSYKFEEAARRGAAGVIVVHETASAGYPWAVVVNSNSQAKLYISTPMRGHDHTALEGWITAKAAEKLFAFAGRNFRKEAAKAQNRGFKAWPMGLTLSTKIRNSNIDRSNSRNVVGLLPGKKRPSEAFLFMAHWDHLGRCPADKTGDDICNGALDNASGTSGLFALAEALGKSKSDRSFLFLALTAEESGLLGSKYYAANPIMPLNKTVAGINMDGMNLFAPVKDMALVGWGKSELQEITGKHVKKQGRLLVSESRPEQGLYYRSDHFSMAKVGVPMLYAKGGIDVIGKGKAWGRAQYSDYVTNRYHKPGDEFSNSMNFKAAAEDLIIYYKVAREIANSHIWPNWYAHDEFRIIRDKSLHEGR